MEIVGRGFIAKNMEPLAAAHQGVVVLAAGVSSTAATAEHDFARERVLLEQTISRCAADGRKVVFFSTASSGLYGSLECAGREDDVVRPRNPYAVHKLRLEELLACSGVDYLVARLSHLVGAHQRGHQLIPALITQLRTGRILIRSGTRRDLIEVRDMVRLTDALLRAGVSREVVNVASGVPVPIEVIVDYLEMNLGLSADRDYVAATDTGVVSIAKLRGLVAEAGSIGFGANYYQETLDAYLETLMPAGR